MKTKNSTLTIEFNKFKDNFLKVVNFIKNRLLRFKDKYKEFNTFIMRLMRKHLM